MLRVRTAG